MTKKGLYCPAGQFYIDPSGAVDHAFVTHAHSDHARKGSRKYYCVTSGVSLLKTRLSEKISVNDYGYGEIFELSGVTISFHPAGHILGSSQVRLELSGQVWVASGDYKREKDPTCWMAPRSLAYDHGFVMSDHADWNDLVRTIQESKAKKVFVPHRGNGALVKHLNSIGIAAFAVKELYPVNLDQLTLF